MVLFIALTSVRLLLVHLAVYGAARVKLVVPSHVGDGAVVHDDYEVRILHGGDALGNDDLGRLGDEALEARADERASVRVSTALVESSG